MSLYINRMDEHGVLRVVFHIQQNAGVIIGIVLYEALLDELEAVFVKLQSYNVTSGRFSAPKQQPAGLSGGLWEEEGAQGSRESFYFVIWNERVIGAA